MPREINDVGKTFGQLTVIRRVDNAGNRKQYLCRYTCGNEEVVKALALRDGTKWRCRRCWLASIKHADPTAKRLKNVYNGMIQRCYNDNPAFKDYGAHGVKVCARWRDADHGFENFVADIGEPPVNVKRWSIDRVDVDGDYEPSNCRWAPEEVQAGNTRRRRTLTVDGETLSFAAWKRRLGLSRGIIAYRVDKLGWPAERALTGAGTSGRRASATADRWQEVARRPVIINRRAYDAVVIAHHKVRATVLVRPGAPAMILAGEADDAALARLVEDVGR